MSRHDDSCRALAPKTGLKTGLKTGPKIGPKIGPSRRELGFGLGALTLQTVLPGRSYGRDARSGRRIVAVGGALTEIIFALGAEGDLVGVDSTSLHPAAARQLPNVGYARTLSAEGILALAPTLVVATEDAGPPETLQRLSAAGVALSILASNHRFEGLIDRVRRLGELSGREVQAERLQKSLEQAWAKARASLTPRDPARPVRVLFILAHAPNQALAAGAGTSAQAMMDYVGVANAMSGFSGYKPLTPEAAVAARPDLVLATEQSLSTVGGAAGILALPGLKFTPAGKERRVAAMDAMFLLGFGPRLPEALSALDATIEQAFST